MTEFTEHEIARETTRDFRKGLGQTGHTVKIASVQHAVSKYTDSGYPIVECSRCGYDRVRVKIDHSPVASDTIEFWCHACAHDIKSEVEDNNEH
jgi:Zn ribbon nucleic-acid-binding protein